MIRVIDANHERSWANLRRGSRHLVLGCKRPQPLRVETVNYDFSGPRTEKARR